MDERLDRVEEQLSRINERLAEVERRVDNLGSAPTTSPRETEQTLPAGEELSIGLSEGSMSAAATHLGRTLLIFGGAYFLRALTDFQVLPPIAGVLLGGAYAFFWLLLADRTSGRAGQRTTAVFYGIASVFLAIPLLVETVSRFHLLTGPSGAAVLAIFCALALIVAARRDLKSLAWLTTVAGVLTALVLLRITHEALPFAVFLLLLGAGSLWVVYRKEWKGLHWIGALGADIGVAIVALLSTKDQWTIDPDRAFLIALVLFIIYPVSFAIRSHLQRRSMGAFEVAQGLLVVGITYWASSATTVGDAGFHASLLGALSLIMGVAAYSLAFTPETRSTRGRNFFFYTTVGLILIVAGSSLVLTPGKAAAAWSVLALVMAIFSGRYGRVTLSLQCTLLLLAAAMGSGIFGLGYDALTGDGTESWPVLSLWHLLLAVTTVACLIIPVAQRSERWGVLAGLPQLIVLALSSWAVGGLMVAYLAPLIAGVPGSEADLGALAALRTFILTASAASLALSSRHKRWPEARWLAYPVLMLIGLKLVFEDFPNGRPLTMFIALALVGGTLILVAKLLRRTSSQESEA